MIRRTISIFIIILSLVFLSCGTPSHKQAGAGQGVEVSAVAIQDNAVEIQFSEPYALSYAISKPSDPYTAVVQMSGVQLGEVPDTVVSDKPGISEVKLSEIQEPTAGVRAEVLLESPVELKGEYKEGVLMLMLAGRAEPEAEPELPEMLEPEPVEAAMPIEKPETYLAATEITDIGFDYKEGFLRLIISGNGSVMPENVFAVEKKIIIDVPETEMRATMPEEVVSPVSALRHGVYEDKLRIVVDLKRAVEFEARSVGDRLLISFPAEEAEIFALEEEVRVGEDEEVDVEEEVAEEDFKGKLVSLDFQDAEIKPIIKLLAKDIGGMNVVIHPDIKGTISLDLENVPWDLALDIILRQSGLEQRMKGNIMRVAPSKIFDAQDKVAPTTKEVIYLDYIAAEDMKTEIENADVLTKDIGKVLTDERLNAIIIYDLEENIEKAKIEVVAHFDTPEHRQMQVLIETKIVEVSTDHTKSLGIRWGGTYSETTAGGDSKSGGFGVNTPITPAGPTLSSPGIGMDAGMIDVGTVSTTAINLSLEALETMGQTRKLANPRVFTIDGETANITQGVQVPMPVITAEGVVGTELKDANLNLTVTPTIRRHDYIYLEVDAKNDTPITLTAGLTGINKQSVTTQALVKDGETLVLGGIYTNTEAEAEIGVPILRKIPLLGWLFKQQTKESHPKELLVFITPRVVK
jgi:type IV pilus assembly protein PilQ